MEKYIIAALVVLVIIVLFFNGRFFNLIHCKSEKDLEKAYGKKCFVSGLYEIQPFYTKGNVVFVNWPVLVLEDSTLVLLESFWEAKDKRSPNEKLELVGKQVKVKGLLHREPPKDKTAQNRMIPCLTKVEEFPMD